MFSRKHRITAGISALLLGAAGGLAACNDFDEWDEPEPADPPEQERMDPPEEDVPPQPRDPGFPDEPDA